MADKNNKVILTCSVCLSRNYTTSRNKAQKTERLELSKYCPKCGKHTLHKETKQEAVMKWFSIEGIKEEIKKVRWSKKADMIKDSETVLTFIVLFGVYFVVCEYLAAAFLAIFGIGA